MQITRGVLSFMIVLVIEANVLDDDFDTPKNVSDPTFSARGSSVMKIPKKAKVDSRARGETQAFKQNASELANPDDYSDENADGMPITISIIPSTEVEYSTTVLTSTTIDDGESWELTTSLNILATSDLWAFSLATTKLSKILKSTKINIRTTRRPAGMQPLQQLFALKSWMNEQQNQSENFQIMDLFRYLKQ